jgi:hypothetical protein
MTNAKEYRGLRVVEHVVKPGQSFEQIARAYMMQHWQPLLIYNTDVFPILKSRDPKLLPSGARIMIPRSPEGYDRLTRSLKALLASVEAFNIKEAAGLDELEARAEGEYVLWDLGGSVATLFVGLGVKALDAAKAAAIAFDAEIVEEPLVNALQFSWVQSEEYAGSIEDFFSRVTSAAQKAVRKAGGEKIFDSLTGKNVALLRKILKAGSVAAKGGVTIRSAAEGIADATKATLEYLDYFKVSTWNRKFLLWYTGQTFEGTVAEQRQRLENITNAQKAMLIEKINAVAAERRLVWR